MTGLAPWLLPLWQPLRVAMEGDRLHHGLLIAGASGLGKRELADALLGAALCSARDADGMACGSCRDCVLRIAGNHPDIIHVGLGLRDDGKQRTEIIVDQVRSLSARLAMSTQLGGLQLALIDPADALNVNAANALLKTLEEPSRATVIILLSDNPARLPATIRSRCQRIDLRTPAPSQALPWLVERGFAEDDATQALRASQGNPGLAARWLEEGVVAILQAAARDLRALSAAPALAWEIAERWADEHAAQRLWFAAVFAKAEAQRLSRGEPGRLGLTGIAQVPKLAAWFTHANRSRSLLETTLRSDLLILQLLRHWPTQTA